MSAEKCRGIAVASAGEDVTLTFYRHDGSSAHTAMLDKRTARAVGWAMIRKGWQAPGADWWSIVGFGVFLVAYLIDRWM